LEVDVQPDTPPWEPTVSVRIVQPLLATVRAKGLDLDEILAAAGLSREVATDLTARIPLPNASRLWEEAAQHSGDPCFGLTTAGMVTPGIYDVAEYAARKHRTLGEGLRVFARFIGLLHDVVRIRFEEDPEAITMVQDMVDGVPPPAVWAEHAMTAFALVGREVTGTLWSPLAMEFMHVQRCDPRRFEEVLGVAPRFGQPRNALVIPRGAWHLPTLEADPQLATILGRYAEALLERREPRGALATRVQATIARSLDGGDVTIEGVAKRLDLPVRGLRRGLREEGTTHRELFDDVRRRLATRYLRDGRWTTEEVAFLTGFSTTSAFVRAFRRWTGQSIGDFTTVGGS
jgi:AraC-like DNA-binding protein